MVKKLETSKLERMVDILIRTHYELALAKVK